MSKAKKQANREIGYWTQVALMSIGTLLGILLALVLVLLIYYPGLFQGLWSLL